MPGRVGAGFTQLPEGAERRSSLGTDHQPPRGLVEPVTVQRAVQRAILALGGLEHVRQGLSHAAAPPRSGVALSRATVHLRERVGIFKWAFSSMLD